MYRWGGALCYRVPHGIKYVNIFLVQFLADKGFSMIDCQFRTDHMESMGGETISCGEYMKLVGGQQSSE